MTRSNDEDPLERLRAADPAAGGPAPDHRSIRNAVHRRLAATGGPEPATPDSAGLDSAGLDSAGLDPAGRTVPEAGGAADELSTRRRRRRPLRYAAAAVGAVLFLGGGYALGAGTGADIMSSAGSESQADHAGSDEAAPEAAPEVGTAPETEPGDTGSEPGSESSDVDQGPWPGGQPTEFTAEGLAEGPARAHAYALDAAASHTGDHAATLAAALDLTGDPHEENGTWVVGSGDGSSPVLRLSPDSTMAYDDPALQPWRCLPVEPENEPNSSAPSEGAGQSTGDSAAAECAETDVPAPPDAADTFATFLTDAGLDPEQYTIRTEDTGSGTGARVTATLLLGGQESDVYLTGTVVPDGIAAVRGTVAAPTDLGEYPLISPTEAVERLMDPRFFGGSDVVSFLDPRFTDNGDSAASSSGVVAVPDPRFSGPAPTPGSPVPWPVRQVQITTAELTLVSMSTSAGVLVLPSYQLTGTDADGTEGTWTVPALTEDAFDFDG